MTDDGGKQHVRTWWKPARVVVGMIAVTAAFTLWFFAVAIYLHDGLATWQMAVLATILFVGLAGYGHWHTVQSRAEVEAADELSPWRHFAIVKSLTLHTESHGDSSLVLELARESSPTMTAATLRFDGVGGFAMQQPFDGRLLFGGLRSQRVARPGNEPAFLRVRDTWNESLAFACRSFTEQASRELAIEAQGPEA